MKKLILIALSTVPVWAWGQTSFHIQGAFKDAGTTGMAYLMYQKQGRYNVDSLPVTAGKFEFSGQVTNTEKDNAGKLYSIKSIPSNFLIDPQGKIIAKNLREKELEKALEDLIGNIAR